MRYHKTELIWKRIKEFIAIYRNLSQFIAICRNLFSMYILNALIRDFTSLFDLFNSDSLISQKSVITGLKKRKKKEKQSEK